MPDLFANIAHLTVQESAANTLTFEQLNTGTGMFEKMAMVISRFEYSPSVATINTLIADDDEIALAWTTSEQTTSIAKDNASVIDNIVFGITAAPSDLYDRPFIHDFSNLPGGGLIVPATSLYLAIKGTSVASAGYARSTIYFTFKQLKGEEYWELLEATRALT